MKTLILTLAAHALAMTFSSCCCNNNSSSKATKRYDSQGRLKMDVHHDGNYTTYHYDGDTKIYSAPTRNRNIADGNFHPENASLIGRAKPPVKSVSRSRSVSKPASKAVSDTNWMPRIP